MQPGRRQTRDERPFETIPGWREHRHETAAGKPRKVLARGREARNRVLVRLSGGEFGLLLARRGAIAMIGAVHQHASLVTSEELRHRRERHYGKRERHA